MIEIVNQICKTGFFLWLFTIPLAIYKGYYDGKEEFKKNKIYYISDLVIIPPNGIENYTIFIYCCCYCCCYYLIYFIFTLLIGIFIKLYFFIYIKFFNSL